jgi:hypothetical protein
MGYYKVLEIRLFEPKARELNRRPVWDSGIAWPLISPETARNHKDISSFLRREAMKRFPEFSARLSKPGTAPVNTREWRIRVWH